MKCPGRDSNQQPQRLKASDLTATPPSPLVLGLGQGMLFVSVFLANSVESTRSVSETDGEWSMWTLWTNCSKTCNGRRIRTRNCDSPQPTINRMCPGVDTQYTLCNADGRSCFGKCHTDLCGFKFRALS